MASIIFFALKISSGLEILDFFYTLNHTTQEIAWTEISSGLLINLRRLMICETCPWAFFFHFQMAQILPTDENFLVLFHRDNPLESSVEFMRVRQGVARNKIRFNTSFCFRKDRLNDSLLYCWTAVSVRCVRHSFVIYYSNHINSNRETQERVWGNI